MELKREGFWYSKDEPDLPMPMPSKKEWAKDAF